MASPMSSEQGQDRTVVLAVVLFLGLIGVGGLGGLVFLIWTGAEATALLAVSNPTMGALGALGGILASTRSAPAAPVQQAVGYQKAISDLHEVNQLAQQGVQLPPPAPG